LTERAALITGGSGGIGLAIARALGQDGYGVTLSARRPDKLEAAAQTLRDEGLDVAAVPANMAKEEEIQRLAAAHRERLGRLDVLINNAGLGVGGTVADTATKSLDLQLDVNLRGVYLMARECIPMLKETGAEHGKALIANTSSYAGKHGQAWLPAYSATKFGVVGLSQALHKELSGTGIQVTALCPGFVATDMTDWIEGQIPKDEMIRAEDIAEAIRFVLRTSTHCIVPEIQFVRPGDSEF
jgi:NAD(P)-dependent dehydrogenase (short-subunit alcohol dehydrogenase family)